AGPPHPLHGRLRGRRLGRPPHPRALERGQPPDHRLSRHEDRADQLPAHDHARRQALRHGGPGIEVPGPTGTHPEPVLRELPSLTLQEETLPIRIILGLGATVIAFAIAGRRFAYLFRLVGKGQPDPRRFTHFRERAWAELSEVGGQRKLLKWTVPGLAHAFTFWGFTILMLTIIEAVGALFSPTFAIPGIGHSAFVAHGIGRALSGAGLGTNRVLETVFLDANVIVIVSFLIFVVYSKHLHIF